MLNTYNRIPFYLTREVLISENNIECMYICLHHKDTRLEFKNQPVIVE